MNSQVAQIARGLGLELETIRSVGGIPERAAPSGKLLIIDLQCPGWSAAEFAPLVSDLLKSMGVVAYAQHVRPELLAEARSAGIDQVMTRGQFSRNARDIIQGIGTTPNSLTLPSQDAAP